MFDLGEERGAEHCTQESTRQIPKPLAWLTSESAATHFERRLRAEAAFQQISLLKFKRGYKPSEVQKRYTIKESTANHEYYRSWAVILPRRN